MYVCLCNYNESCRRSSSRRDYRSWILAMLFLGQFFQVAAAGPAHRDEGAGPPPPRRSSSTRSATTLGDQLPTLLATSSGDGGSSSLAGAPDPRTPRAPSSRTTGRAHSLFYTQDLINCCARNSKSNYGGGADNANDAHDGGAVSVRGGQHLRAGAAAGVQPEGMRRTATGVPLVQIQLQASSNTRPRLGITRMCSTPPPAPCAAPPTHRLLQEPDSLPRSHGSARPRSASSTSSGRLTLTGAGAMRTTRTLSGAPRVEEVYSVGTSRGASASASSGASSGRPSTITNRASCVSASSPATARARTQSTGRAIKIKPVPVQPLLGPPAPSSGAVSKSTTLVESFLELDPFSRMVAEAFSRACRIAGQEDESCGAVDAEAAFLRVVGSRDGDFGYSDAFVVSVLHFVTRSMPLVDREMTARWLAQRHPNEAWGEAVYGVSKTSPHDPRIYSFVPGTKWLPVLAAVLQRAATSALLTAVQSLALRDDVVAHACSKEVITTAPQQIAGDLAALATYFSNPSRIEQLASTPGGAEFLLQTPWLDLQGWPGPGAAPPAARRRNYFACPHFELTEAEFHGDQHRVQSAILDASHVLSRTYFGARVVQRVWELLALEIADARRHGDARRKGWARKILVADMDKNAAGFLSARGRGDTDMVQELLEPNAANASGPLRPDRILGASKAVLEEYITARDLYAERELEHNSLDARAGVQRRALRVPGRDEEAGVAALQQIARRVKQMIATVQPGATTLVGATRAQDRESFALVVPPSTQALDYLKNLRQDLAGLFAKNGTIVLDPGFLRIRLTEQGEYFASLLKKVEDILDIRTEKKLAKQREEANQRRRLALRESAAAARKALRDAAQKMNLWNYRGQHPHQKLLTSSGRTGRLGGVYGGRQQSRGALNKMQPLLETIVEDGEELDEERPGGSSRTWTQGDAAVEAEPPVDRGLEEVRRRLREMALSTGPARV